MNFYRWEDFECYSITDENLVIKWKRDGILSWIKRPRPSIKCRKEDIENLDRIDSTLIKHLKKKN